MTLGSGRRVRLTYGQKLQVLAMKRADSGMSRPKMVKWATEKFKLPKPPSPAYITKIYQDEAKLLAIDPREHDLKSQGDSDRRKLTYAVLEEVLEIERKKEFATGRLIKTIAQEKLAELKLPEAKVPKLSNGWLHHFQLFGLLSYKRCSGEADSADVEGFMRALPELQKLISSYRLDDVYNLDETAFNYNSTPRGSICRGRAPSLKKDKSRITGVFCVNGTGSDKRCPWWLGTAMRPRCVNKESKKSESAWKNLAGKRQHPQWVHFSGAVYKNSKKGWMTAKIFQAYLKAFDEDMQRQGRRVLLLIDNASMHRWDAAKLKNVTVKMLPPNTTSICQPLDQTVMAAWKNHVLNLKVYHWYKMMKTNQSHHANVLQAMDWGMQAWDEISPSSIRNGWKKLVPVSQRMSVDSLIG